MEEVQQGILYYQALVANGLNDGEPVMGQEAELWDGPQEYMDTEYELGNSKRIWMEMGTLIWSPVSLPPQR